MAWLRVATLGCILQPMKLAQIEQQALALSERERALLAVRLLDTVPPADATVSDEEVEERERDMESGRVEAIPHEEFVRRVQQECGR